MIRPITPSDRGSIDQLLRDTGAFRSEEHAVAMELVDEILHKGSASGYRGYCFCDRHSRLSGYICFGPVPMTERSYDLYWIAVDPRAARRGIGSRLVRFMESSIARTGGGTVYIETSSTAPYEAAAALYRKGGYSLAALLNDFYRGGDHKLVFRKEITPRQQEARSGALNSARGPRERLSNPGAKEQPS